MKLSSLHDTTIGEAVRKTNRKAKFQAALRRADKSQVEVADECDVDESTISRYKSGIRDPSLGTLRKLARQGMDVVDLFAIKSGEPDTVRKKGLRSKAHSSRVSEKMREASRQAQINDRLNEPHHRVA